MRRVLRFLALLLALPAVASAEVNCNERMWKPYSEQELNAKGLTPTVKMLAIDIDRAREYQSLTVEISIVVTDCRIRGLSVHTIKNPQSPLTFTREYTVSKRGYAIHLTSAYLRNDTADLRHRIQKEVCLIAEGIADNPYRVYEDERSHSVKKCMYEVALNSQDYDYATWVLRTTPPSERSREAILASLQKWIDYLYSLPTIPVQAIRRLEAARRTLIKRAPQ